MIKIRANVLGTKEYLEMEKQLQPDKELKQDENLEKVVFKIENVEQVKFF
jgi:hypothetical protein